MPDGGPVRHLHGRGPSGQSELHVLHNRQHSQQVFGLVSRRRISGTHQDRVNPCGLCTANISGEAVADHPNPFWLTCRCEREPECLAMRLLVAGHRRIDYRLESSAAISARVKTLPGAVESSASERTRDHFPGRSPSVPSKSHRRTPSAVTTQHPKGPLPPDPDARTPAKLKPVESGALEADRSRGFSPAPLPHRVRAPALARLRPRRPPIR